MSVVRWGLVAALAVALPGLAQQNVERVEDGPLVKEAIPEIDADVIEGLRRYGEVRGHGFSGWAADGSAIISTRFGETSQIHQVAMPMGARRQITFYSEPVGGASLNAGGDAFLFSKDTGGNEFFQAYVYDIATGNVVQMSEPGTRNGAATWSDDGAMIAWYKSTAADPDWDVYVATTNDPASRRKVLDGDGAMFPLDWSADGSRLLIGKYVSITKSHLYELDLASGELTEVAPEFDVSFGGGEYIDGGERLLVTLDKDSEFRRLAKLDIDSAEVEVLTPDIDWDVEGVEVAPNGRQAVFSVNAGGMSDIYRIDLRNGRISDGPKLGPGLAGGFEFSADGRRVGFTFNSAQSPSDVYSFEYTNPSRVTRWTEAEIGGLPSEDFVTPSLITFRNEEGMDIPAWYYKPKGEGPFPVVVSIHGGPESQSRAGFSSTYQYWVNELGLAVLVPNVRGSSGYGKTYVAMDNGFNRKKSVADIGHLLTWIGDQSELDADRVAVFGGSYGGYMVLASMVDFPDRLVGGVNIVGISNFVTFLENTKGYRRDLRRAEYGDERDPEMRAFLEEISPLNSADRIEDPLFIVQGFNDPRVPASEAEQILAAMRAEGREAWYLLAMNEGHGFRKKSNRDYYQQATAMFFKHIFDLEE